MIVIKLSNILNKKYLISLNVPEMQLAGVGMLKSPCFQVPVKQPRL